LDGKVKELEVKTKAYNKLVKHNERMFQIYKQ